MCNKRIVVIIIISSCCDHHHKLHHRRFPPTRPSLSSSSTPPPHTHAHTHIHTHTTTTTTTTMIIIVITIGMHIHVQLMNDRLRCTAVITIAIQEQKIFNSILLSNNVRNILHYSKVIMSAMAFQITGVLIVNSIVCSGADPRKHQNSASLTFVREIHQYPVNY